MTFLRGNAEKPGPMWFIVDRTDFGAFGLARRQRAAALVDFGDWLRGASEAGEPYTPYERGRRLLVLGPDAVVLPESPDDPLLIGEAALRSVLTPDEYQLYVHGPVATALLES